MNEEVLKKEFGETFSQLLAHISTFELERFNRKPAENKWSAGQVARHLIKATSGFPKIISGQSETTERDPFEIVGKIKADFLDFATPMDAPDFIVPEDRQFAKEEMIDQLEKIKSQIAGAIAKTDLTKTFKSFEFPVYGYLTGWEMLAFVIYHTQRHLHQLGKIQEKISGR